MLAPEGYRLGDFMIDIRKLKELVKLMVENDLCELDLRDAQETVVVKRPMGHAGPPLVMHAPAAGNAAPGYTPAPLGGGGAPDAGAGEEDESGLHAIVSPMVGTFYSSPDPESPPFVTAGSRVEPHTVVCIVEAMKVFSEIKAECTGVIERVLVKTGEPVEYGQKLFLVRTT